MKTIRWGIIGCGNVTEMKSGPAFNKVPDSTLHAVMRRDENRLKDYAARHQVLLSFTDASALIHHPEIDAVYIATPPHVHEQYAIEALRANKFVYVEKPMATTVSACLNMQKVADELNGKLVIAHYRRELPLFLKVKSLLAENRIGVVHKVQLIMRKNKRDKNYYVNNWRINKEMAGAGFFYDLAPHQLDLVFYFFGPAQYYKGEATNKSGLYEVEDTVHGNIQLQNGVQFEGEWSFENNNIEEIDSFTITGDAGSISFPVFGHDITIVNQGETQFLQFDPPMHNQQNLIEKVVAYFLDQGENPCSSKDAIESMRVMESFVYGNKL